MKITMYELLGMVKDGKAPKKIIYRDNLFEYTAGLEDYRADDVRKYHGNHLFHYLFEEEVKFLNDEVEILEEEKKIPEKLNLDTYATIGTEVDKDVIVKINEIIDYLKIKGDE